VDSRCRFIGSRPGRVLHAEQHGVLPVDLLEPDLHGLALRGRQVLAHVVGADRQLPVPAVDEHRELHRARAPDVAERVERGPDGAAGEEHVVDQHHEPAVDPAAGISVRPSARAGLSRRSSRYMVTSSVPTGRSSPSTAAICAPSRVARWAPRVGIPSSTASSAPWVRSRISWAIRVRARFTAEASSTARIAGVGRLDPGDLRRRARCESSVQRESVMPKQTPFPASRDRT
jgi:hypothetical protein